MTNYRRGINFEFRVRNLFRKFGYEAERKAASSPYDIIVMRHGVVKFLIDAKKTSQSDKKYIYVKKYDIEKIIKESGRLYAMPLIVYGFDRSSIFVVDARDCIEKEIVRLESGLKLSDFLSAAHQEP